MDWATNRSFSSSLPHPCYNPRVVLSWQPVDEEVHVAFEANLISIKQFKCSNDLLELFQMIETLLPNSGFVMCSGLDDSAEELNINCKNARKWSFPFKRTDHVECNMWFQKPPNSSLNRCGKCRDLGYYIKKESQRRQSVTPERKARRVLPSSNYPISKLTPTTQRARINSIRIDRSKLAHTMKSNKKLLETSVNYSTHCELIELVSKIQRTSKEQLQTVMAEADAVGKGDMLREAWKQDVEERIAFDKDQRRNGNETRNDTCS